MEEFVKLFVSKKAEIAKNWVLNKSVSNTLKSNGIDVKEFYKLHSMNTIIYFI